MKRRLNIACAIVHEPEIIIMDEPTVGIDPQSRNRILDTIRDLRDQGKTIIYTTHYMEEVEAISTRIIIMDHGDIIARGTKESLKAEMGDIRTFTITVEDGRTINSDAIYSIEGIKEVKIQGESIKVTSLLSIENLDQVIAVLIGQNIKIQSIQTAMVNLEHVFLDLTGRTLRD
ncbi:hypothetical protein [Erysipelothrix sp. HDW6C]|uniref:hypothetical protein n=1 Tax=Erysipelothrix sp. HDW6C TaxID=2714930 RepID=UPI00196A379B|nr:hypothetical protein [Erysipelothrix sp. HDW6C]